MYAAGIMDHFSDAPRMELIVWGSTAGILARTVFRVSRQVKRARRKAGAIRPSSTGPRFWTRLLILGHVGTSYLPPLIYCTTTIYHKFQQPEWMAEYTLPPPADMCGVDGVTVGRTVGLLGFLAATVLTDSAMDVLGDQFQSIGVREKPRLVDSGPFAYVRHPVYTGSLIAGASFALAFWSYLPLYVLPVAIGACILRVPIEEEAIMRDPELGNEYRAYRHRVPYRIIPYIW